MSALRYLVALVAMLVAGCGWDPCAGLTEPSVLCPNGPSYAAPADAGTDAGDIPCGTDVCDDGAGGMLQDVGEHCGADDESPLPGVATCCHGLTCVGALASSMGTCARGAVTAGPPTCPKGGLWVYQCDGLFALKNNAMAIESFTGEFTGPPPDVVGATAQGGLNAWMKIRFAAKFPRLTIGGFTYYYMGASNCRPIGPVVMP